MESTVCSTAALHAIYQTAVTKQQENALEDVNPDGKEFSVNKVIFIFWFLKKLSPLERNLFIKVVWLLCLFKYMTGD